MSNTLLHKTPTVKPNGADATKISATPWNEEHVFSGASTGALLLRDTTATDGVTWSAVGTVGPSLPNLTITTLLTFGVRGSQTLPGSGNGNILLRGSDPEIDFENTSAPDAVRRWGGCFVNAVGDFEIANAYDNTWGNVQTYLIVHAPSTDTNAYGVHAYLQVSAVGFKSLGGAQANFNAAYEFILNGSNGNWSLTGGDTYFYLNSVKPGIDDALPFLFTRSGPAVPTGLWLSGRIAWGASVCHPSTITSGGSPSIDTGISRSAAGIVAVGNGTQNDRSGLVDSAGYKVAGAAGIDASITTASLSGKTITVSKGIITGFA
jgi:hypothetical protein